MSVNYVRDDQVKLPETRLLRTIAFPAMLAAIVVFLPTESSMSQHSNPTFETFNRALYGTIPDPSLAQPSSIMEAADVAIEKGDWPGAFEVLLQLAEDGNAEAQLFVSLIYGREVNQEEQLEKAMKKGLKGPSVNHDIEWKRLPIDLGSSVKYLEKSALQNHPDALFLLGMMYLNGRHFEQNDAKGFDLVEKSATLGHVSARNFLLTTSMNDGDWANAFKWAVVLVGCTEEGLAKFKKLKRLVKPEVFSVGMEKGIGRAVEHFVKQGVDCARQAIEAALARE